MQWWLVILARKCPTQYGRLNCILTTLLTLGSNDQDDYWKDASLTEATDDAIEVPPALTVQTIEGVEPLDDQFGVLEPLTVPSSIWDVLFSQSEQIEGRVSQPIYTYAIVDAAKAMGLVEMLEASGLDHSCLFQGKAAEELRDVAPYIVRLEESNAFTRNLFTKGDSGWQMWDRKPGIYLRSPASLGEIRKHFRKFTKVRREDGKWFYFRFWDRDAQEAMVHAARGALPEMERLFITSCQNPLLCAYLPSFSAIITSERIWATDAAPTAITPNDFLAMLLQIIKQQRTHRDLSAIASKIDVGTEDSALMEPLGMLFDAGFTNKAQLSQLGQIEFASQFRFLRQPHVYAVIHSQEPRYAAFVRLMDMATLQELVHAAG